MYTRNRGDLHATRGSTFIYAWWFFLSSTVVADTSYWHIFQVQMGRNVAGITVKFFYNTKWHETF
jgi:hypothetical protein